MKDFRDRSKCSLSSEHKPACPKPCTAPLSTLLFWRKKKGFRLSQVVAYCKNLKLKPSSDNVPVHYLLFFCLFFPQVWRQDICPRVFWSKEKIFSRYFLHVQIIIRVLKYFFEMEKRCSSVLLGITENTNSAMLTRPTVSSAWRTYRTGSESQSQIQLRQEQEGWHDHPFPLISPKYHPSEWWLFFFHHSYFVAVSIINPFL